MERWTEGGVTFTRGVSYNAPKDLRDEFAMAALAGMATIKTMARGIDERARAAYQYADTMMEARKT